MTSSVSELGRRSIRLRGFDYSRDGAYFVTICTRGRACLLADVVGGEMRLSEAGRVVQEVWEGLPLHYPHVQTDAWVIMPNHVHGIIVLSAFDTQVRACLNPAPTARANETRHGLPEIVRALKTFSARRINALRGAMGSPFWQRNYYEHVIRDDDSLNRIRQYIMDNPARWGEDPENPMVVGEGKEIGSIGSIDVSAAKSAVPDVGVGFKPAPTEPTQ